MFLTGGSTSPFPAGYSLDAATMGNFLPVPIYNMQGTNQ
jgi:hypothetical protein